MALGVRYRELPARSNLGIVTLLRPVVTKMVLPSCELQCLKWCVLWAVHQSRHGFPGKLRRLICACRAVFSPGVFRHTPRPCWEGFESNEQRDSISRPRTGTAAERRRVGFGRAEGI